MRHRMIALACWFGLLAFGCNATRDTTATPASGGRGAPEAVVGGEPRPQADAVAAAIDRVLPLPVGFEPVYRIEKSEDASYASVSRTVLRVSVPPGLSRKDVELNLKHAVKQTYTRHHPDAIEVFAYRRGEPAKGSYSVAHCTFAPYGQWGRASEKPPLDKYSTVTGFNDAYFLVETKAVAGQPREVKQTINGWKVTILTYIPEDRRKAIFFDLVQAQDRGVGDEQAYDVIAKKYKLKNEEVRKIAGEGAVKSWPMP
jgi:hypothetical protein